MIDVDPELCAAHRGRGDAERDFASRCRARWRRRNLPAPPVVWSRVRPAGRKAVLFEHAVFVPRRARPCRVAGATRRARACCQRVAIGPHVAHDHEALMLAEDPGDLGEGGVALVHAWCWRGGVSICCRMSMTRVPRSMESSRWKTRCGVYFRTTCLAKLGLQGGPMWFELGDDARAGARRGR